MSELIAKNLAKSYKGKTVVHDVSIAVKQGTIVGLLGPNGAGKTTSFYMIVGLVQADKGSISIDGKDITNLPMHARARLGIGYLPQEASVFRKLTTAQNIMAILETRSELTTKQRKEKLAGLLDEFNIEHVKNSKGISLSGGERRRVEIARALAMDPKFILLDEPFAGVDPISVGDIKRIIQYLQERGLGVLITDHNVRETLDVCNHAHIVNAGHLIAEGLPADILNNKKVREVYLGDQFVL